MKLFSTYKLIYYNAVLLIICFHWQIESFAQGDNKPLAPTVLPGNGLLQYDFFYAGEGKVQNMYIIRNGISTWSFQDTLGKGEISDAVMLSNGNILFAHQYGVTEITQEKKVIWNYNAPQGCEIHTAQPIGKDNVLFIQNGDPAKLIVINKPSGILLKELVLPVGNPKGVHGQFRNARITSKGTILVAHMDFGKICEYDENAKELLSINVPSPWSAVELKNGNILVCSNNGFVHELNRKGEKIWEFTHADAPEYTLFGPQKAIRLPNGNTIINSWFNQWSGTVDTANAPIQLIEVTSDKKIVWALRSWTEPINLGPSTTVQLLNDSVIAENVNFGNIK
jgi:hypothetical protein